MATDLLYIVSTLRRSGPTNQLYYLLKYLDDDFNAKVLTLSPEPEESELDRFQELNIEYETLGLSRIKGAVVGPSRLRRKVREYDPDIIHTQGIRADTLSAMFLSAYPRVTTIRNYAYDDYPAKYGQLQGSIMTWTHLRALKQIDHPIACSETIASRMADVGVDSKAIQNGIDTEMYRPVDSSEKIRLRNEFDIPESATVFVSVGTLIPRKNPTDVIEGFQEADIEDSILLMLGDGPLREECESLAVDDDQVRIEGWVDNVSGYLGASDYFISASNSEGLPNTVMEALAVGLPVVLSDIQPHQEILQYDADAGIKFELEGTGSLAAAIGGIVEKNHLTRTTVVRELVITHLSAEQMSEEYQVTYRDIQETHNGQEISSPL